jgi:hypothetical protein
MLGSIRSSMCAFAVVVCSNAAIASPFTYQGSLMDGGVPANGFYDMTFQLADSAVLGFLLDSDTVLGVEVIEGVFTVEIDFDDTITNHDARWIAIVVEGVPLSPRVRMRATPRAYNAVNADSAGTVEVPLFVSATNATINSHATSSTGTALLGYHDNNSGTAAAIHGRTHSVDADAQGVVGEVTSTSPGALSSGIRGINNGRFGLGIGVHGSQGGSGWGVYGTTPSGRGVYGQSDSGTGMYALTTTGTGLIASHTDASTIVSLATDTFAIDASHDSVDGNGTAIHAIGGRIGIHGEATSSGFGPDLTRTGVRGTAGSFSTGADTFYGVYGFGQAPAEGGARTAYGVYGGAQSGASGSTGYGVYGEIFGPGTNYAGYFAGSVHIQGTLSKSLGTFKIDHPSDPENKYLSHSFVESPDMMNIYNGVAVLDNRGSASVELPDYFESLNQSFRYQLTAIGASMPNLYISSEVSANEFAIAGGVAGAKVSWQVTGIRKDPTALSHPIIVEEEKSVQHRGKYLNPDSYGFGNERAIHPSPKQNEN